MKTGGKATDRRRSGFRSIVWLLLVAFTLQSFITATHIHGAFGASDAAIAKAQPAAPSHSKAPDNGDVKNCPFCQAIIHSGAFFAPSAPNLLLPVMLAAVAAPAIASDVIDSLSSHTWRSRAPPQA